MEKPKLYKLDSKGKTRVWWIEYDQTKYRSHSGIDQGKITASGWVFPEQKNVGKINQTSVAEQVIAEVDAEYTKQLNQGKYHESIETIDQGASFFQPMLANKFKYGEGQYPAAVQPKLDGIRCVATKDGLFTRKGKPIISVPHIIEALEYVFKAHPNWVIDGELYNHELKHDFEQIVSMVRKQKPTDEDMRESARLVQYHIYDMFDKNDPNMPFEDRINLIDEHFLMVPKALEIVSTSTVTDDDDVDRLTARLVEQGYEGAMKRDYKSPYHQKRTNALLKVKNMEDHEYILVGLEEGVGNWAGRAKSAIIKDPDTGDVQRAGIRGNYDFTAKLLRDLDQLVGTDVTVAVQNATAKGKARFAIVTKFWYGKRDM